MVRLPWESGRTETKALSRQSLSFLVPEKKKCFVECCGTTTTTTMLHRLKKTFQYFYLFLYFVDHFIKLTSQIKECFFFNPSIFRHLRTFKKLKISKPKHFFRCRLRPIPRNVASLYFQPKSSDFRKNSFDFGATGRRTSPGGSTSSTRPKSSRPERPSSKQR